MVDKELALNGSGYYDETAYKGMTAGPKPGEIWKRDDDRLFIIIARRDSVCSTLSLIDKKGDNSITVMAMVPMYTSPIMVGYAFASRMIQYIKKVPDEEMLSIRRSVGAALGLTVTNILPDAAKRQDDERKRLEEKFACLAAENEDLKQGYIDLHKENDKLTEKLVEIENLCEKDEKERKKAESALEKANMQRDMYRDMYMELFDRIIAHEVRINERR